MVESEAFKDVYHYTYLGTNYQCQAIPCKRKKKNNRKEISVNKVVIWITVRFSP